MSEWKEYRLGDFLQVKYGKDHKILEEGNIPVYGSGGIMRYGDKYLYDQPSVLIPRKGTLSNIFFVEKPFWTVDTMFWTIIDSSTILPKYLYYAIKDYRWDSLNVGSAVPSLTVPVIEGVSINLPPLATQRSIASILSSLDDKIETNRKICANLEAQAQALFKHWFIDFAPFKDGKFVESELGMIPEGWRVGMLGEIAEFKRGKTITKENTTEGSIPVVAGGLEPAYYHNESNTSSRVITISGSGANAGFTRMYYVPVWASDCSFVDSASTSFLHTAYCYLLTNKKNVDALQWGAAQPHVYAKDINKLSLTIAPFEVLTKFEELVGRMFDSIEIYETESSRLATLRDTLLPKLMSGQIKV